MKRPRLLSDSDWQDDSPINAPFTSTASKATIYSLPAEIRLLICQYLFQQASKFDVGLKPDAETCTYRLFLYAPSGSRPKDVNCLALLSAARLFHAEAFEVLQGIGMLHMPNSGRLSSENFADGVDKSKIKHIFVKGLQSLEDLKSGALDEAEQVFPELEEIVIKVSEGIMDKPSVAAPGVDLVSCIQHKDRTYERLARRTELRVRRIIQGELAGGIKVTVWFPAEITLSRAESMEEWQLDVAYDVRDRTITLIHGHVEQLVERCQLKIFKRVCFPPAILNGVKTRTALPSRHAGGERGNEAI